MIKYHKIKGIDKRICTAEQKVAYNMAFNIHIERGDEYDAMKTAVDKSNAIAEWVDTECRLFSQNHPEAKIDIDGVFAALRLGLPKYLTKDGFFIATDYRQIGDAFPAVYR